MFSNLLSTFLLGLGLSLSHCFFMCGGLMILFSYQKTNVFEIGLYHFFRIFAYMIIGTFAFLLGSYFTSKYYQIILFLTLGIFCILLGFAFIMRSNLLAFFENQFIYKKIFAVLNKKKTSKYKAIIFGFLNGFFPCGLVYFFVAKSIMSKSTIEAALNMLFFGLSTLPAMFFSSVLINKIKFLSFLKYILFILVIAYGFYLCFLALKLSR